MSPVRATTRKALRDLSRQRGQAIAVGVTIALGVAVFVASGGAFRNLSASYEHTYADLAFADLVATGGDAEQVAAAVRASGATAVEIRSQRDVPLTIDGTRLVGRVVGMPDPADVDRVRVVDGTAPTADDDVLLERHAAAAFDVGPGDTLQVWTGAGWTSARVSGVVVSPEYLWPARNRQDVFADPHSFAVVFAPQGLVDTWLPGAPREVLATVGEDSVDAAAAAARAGGAVDVVGRAQHPSHATLQEDLDAFADMAVTFPLLFLTAAAVAAYVALTRRVRVERPTIGTFLAAGARPARVARHYASQGFVVGTLGSLAGVALGVPLTALVTRGYTSALGIPDTVVELHPALVVVGLALGPLVGVLGAAAPAVAAARTAPAEAMRPQGDARGPGRWNRAVSRLTVLPVTVRLALRDVARGPRRTAATALGAVLALVLVVSSLSMMTSMSAAFAVQFGEIQREDATVVAEAGAGDLGATLAAVPGVTAVEGSDVGRVVAAHDGETYATTLVGLRPGTRMHGFRATDGNLRALPADGVLAGAAIADRLGVEPGDTLQLTGPGGAGDVRLVGLLAEPLGTSLYGSRASVAPLVDGSGTSTWLLQLAPSADRDAVRRTISSLDGVVAYSDAQAVVGMLEQFLGLFWAFVGVMVALGAALALAVVHVTTAVSLGERSVEIATLRAAGVPAAAIARSLAASNVVATALGVPLGLACGYAAGAWFMGTFSTDLFSLPFSAPWWVATGAAAAVLAGAWASQWTAVRAVRRVDVARVVRERAL